MIVSQKGYIDITPELIAGICSITQGRPYATLIRVVGDAVPEVASVSHIESMNRSVRVWLDGVEPRQYQPCLTAYYPRGTTARLVMVDANSPESAVEYPSIPRIGEFDGIGTVKSADAQLVSEGRYEVRIGYEEIPQ